MAKGMTAAEVKRLRESLGQTQAQFAALVGVETNTVWRWENGARNITAPWPEHIRRKVADAQAAQPATATA